MVILVLVQVVTAKSLLLLVVLLFVLVANSLDLKAIFEPLEGWPRSLPPCLLFVVVVVDLSDLQGLSISLHTTSSAKIRPAWISPFATSGRSSWCCCYRGTWNMRFSRPSFASEISLIHLQVGDMRFWEIICSWGGWRTLAERLFGRSKVGRLSACSPGYDVNMM